MGRRGRGEETKAAALETPAEAVAGAEAVLKLKADTLSDSDPLTTFWSRRQANQTGLHRRCSTRKTSAA